MIRANLLSLRSRGFVALSFRRLLAAISPSLQAAIFFYYTLIIYSAEGKIYYILIYTFRPLFLLQPIRPATRPSPAFSGHSLSASSNGGIQDFNPNKPFRLPGQ